MVSGNDPLTAVAESVVSRIADSDLCAKLSPPRLLVQTNSSHAINSFTVPISSGASLIVFGGGLYDFIARYMVAAAIRFRPPHPASAAPASWLQARSAMASAIEWAALRGTGDIPAIPLTPGQARVAQAITDHTYRFVLCHEMAHVLLEHTEHGVTMSAQVNDRAVAALKVSQDQELEADRLGLRLQIGSTADVQQVAQGLASSVYFIHVMGLLDLRLMLLARLVDADAWQIHYSHPPTFQRLFNLLGAAEGILPGSQTQLRELHDDLKTFDEEIGNAAIVQQERVESDVRASVAAEAAGGPEATAEPMISAARRSPLGVLRALDRAELADSKLIEIADRLARHLPSELQRFRDLSPADRAALG